MKIGEHVIIEGDCEFGDNVTIGNYAYIKKGTRVGDNVVIGSYVRTGANCIIGEDSIIKCRATISPDCIIGKRTFLGPHAMMLHATPEGEHMPSRLGSDVFVGACALVGPGVAIGDHVTLGAMAFAHKDCLERGLYVGVPAKKLK